MKAVVLEIKGKEAVVMKEDGTIERIIRDCQVGEEIIINEKPTILKFPRKYIAIAASFALALILGAGGYVYAAPTSYVTMDANLSFEFALNAFDEVVSMKSLSDEGRQIEDDYNKISSFHPTIDEAVALTSELLYNSNYLSTDSRSDVLISAVSGDDVKSAELSEKAKTAVSEIGSKYGSTTEVATAIASPQTRAKAASEGLSTGQYIKDNSGAKNDRFADDVTIADGNSTKGTTGDVSVVSATDGSVAIVSGESDALTPANIDTDVIDGSSNKNDPAVENTDKQDAAISNDDKQDSSVITDNSKEDAYNTDDSVAIVDSTKESASPAAINAVTDL